MTHQADKKLRPNVRLYPWYAAFFWIPVFFLYFGAHLPLSKVLQLEGIYCIAVDDHFSGCQRPNENSQPQMRPTTTHSGATAASTTTWQRQAR